jgi:hypothetical protein
MCLYAQTYILRIYCSTVSYSMYYIARDKPDTREQLS